MNPFDVVIIATLRPELIEKTVRSFHENLWKDWIRHARFCVNVDRAGCEDEKEIYLRQREILNFFDKYLYPKGSHALINFTLRPDFPTAFIWGVGMTKNRLVFHLEEDWTMNFEQSFDKMVSMFDKYSNLKHLRLNLFVSTEESVKMWGRHFAHWNGDFYQIEKESVISAGWCGHPSLNDGSWLRACVSLMNKEKNPEKQFHYNGNIVKNYIEGKDFGVFHTRGKGRGIKDIGRAWMKEHGYRKTGGINREWFKTWEKEKK